jgi:uncharacterized membrane protein
MENSMLSGKRTAVNTSYKKPIRILLLVFILPVILYYLWTRGIVYLNFSRGVYTDYFWFRAPWLLVHVICGVTATIIGGIQFIPSVRTRNPALHRNMGKIYLGCILLSTLVSFYLVSTAQLGIVYATGLAMLGIVWLGSAAMAYMAIRKGNVFMHREWMIKTYVLTLSFVCFRLTEDILTKMGISSFVDRKVLLAWGSWAIPFFITEVVLQAGRMIRKGSAIERTA